MQINRPYLYSAKHWICHTLATTVLLAFLFVPFFALAEVSSSNNNPEYYYGTQSLNPMVMEDETIIYLPGGAELAIQGGETKYSLTDHLQSTRLAMAKDNTTSSPDDYSPFGNNPNPASNTEKQNRYTGMTYEPETATYDLSLIHI